MALLSKKIKKNIRRARAQRRVLSVALRSYLRKVILDIIIARHEMCLTRTSASVHTLPYGRSNST